MKKRQEVYDLYWYFACERQNIFIKKYKGGIISCSLAFLYIISHTFYNYQHFFTFFVKNFYFPSVL